MPGDVFVMRFVSYSGHGGERLGILVRDQIIDAQECARHHLVDTSSVSDLVSLIETCVRDGLDIGALFDNPPPGAVHDASSVVRRAPLRPSTILCAGSNYRAQNLEKANTPLSGKEPEFFVKPADCVIGPDDGIVSDRKLTEKLDCETELAIV